MTIRRAQFVFVRIFWLVSMTVLVGSLFAQNGENSAWEGAGAAGSVGEFPPAGLYAASDTFPRNSIVDVMNMDSGQSARLIVVRRVDAPGLFMLVSPEAAKNLGMSGTGTARLRVTPVMLPGLADLNPNRDLPYSPDPDINPVASLSDPNAAVKAARSETAVAPQASRAPAAAQAPARAETPQQDFISPAAAGAAQITGNATPKTGNEVVPQIAAGPQAALPPLRAPVGEPVQTPITEPAQPFAGQSAQSVAGQPAQSVASQPAQSVASQPAPVPAGPSVPLPEAASPQVNDSQIVSPATPEVPQAIAEASPAPLKRPAETAFGGVIAIPPAPEKPAAAVVESGSASGSTSTTSNLFSRPDAVDAASAELSRLESRTGQSSLFVPPRPEDTLTLLSPPASPSQGLSLRPEELAVAAPQDRGFPVAGALPLLSAPTGQPLGAVSSVPSLPGSPQVAQTAPVKPVATAAESGPIASEILAPQRFREAPLSAALPIAQAPGSETPSVADLRLQAATESQNSGALPIAIAPGIERPEIADLGPVAPPKPQSLVAATVTPPLPAAGTAAAGTAAATAAAASTPSSTPSNAGPETPVASPQAPRVGTAEGVTPVPQEQPSIRDQLLKPRTGPAPATGGQTPAGEIALVPAEPPPATGNPTASTASAPPASASSTASTASTAPVAAASNSTATAIPASIAGESWARSNLPLVNALQSNYYYLQIGAFNNPEGAKQALDRVASGYPLVVLPVREHGRIVYRLFVGPLRDDEKGAVLYWFKAKGYSDAFVRRGGES